MAGLRAQPAAIKKKLVLEVSWNQIELNGDREAPPINNIN